MTFHVPEKYRDSSIMASSKEKDGNNGMFLIPGRSARDALKVIASDGMGFDHVSVSKRYELPSWDEMCKIKEIFWDDEDCVMQLHPPKSEYVNNHPYCLHLWRPNDGRKIPKPERICV